jgi:hypothetical protein
MRSRSRVTTVSVLNMKGMTKLQPSVTIWTRDKRLKKIADELARSPVLEH